jgi:hypothetical protein
VKGWIPIELINENVTKIFVRSNLDLNTYIFSFNIDKMPITFMEEPNLQTEKIKIHRLDIPSWWNNGIIGKPKTFHRINSGEIINLVLDEKNGNSLWMEKKRQITMASMQGRFRPSHKPRPHMLAEPL